MYKETSFGTNVMLGASSPEFKATDSGCQTKRNMETKRVNSCRLLFLSIFLSLFPKFLYVCSVWEKLELDCVEP